jgi:hypothetical protein
LRNAGNFGKDAKSAGSCGVPEKEARRMLKQKARIDHGTILLAKAAASDRGQRQCKSHQVNPPVSFSVL